MAYKSLGFSLFCSQLSTLPTFWTPNIAINVITLHTRLDLHFHLIPCISRKFDWKNVVIWKINSFSELNLTIAQDPSIIFSFIQKTWQIKFGELHKKLLTAKFNSMSNFLLIQYYTTTNAKLKFRQLQFPSYHQIFDLPSILCIRYKLVHDEYFNLWDTSYLKF